MVQCQNTALPTYFWIIASAITNWCSLLSWHWRVLKMCNDVTVLWGCAAFSHWSASLNIHKEELSYREKEENTGLIGLGFRSDLITKCKHLVYITGSFDAFVCSSSTEMSKAHTQILEMKNSLLLRQMVKWF